MMGVHMIEARLEFSITFVDLNLSSGLLIVKVLGRI